MPFRWLLVATTLLVVLALSLAAEPKPKLPGVLVDIVPPPRLGSDPVHGLAISPDGKHLEARTSKGKLLAWVLDAKGNGRRVEDPPPASATTPGAHHIARSADGKLVATGNDERTVVVAERATNRVLHQLQGHEGLITAVAFGPEVKTVVSASLDRTVRVWDVPTGKELRRFEGHRDRVNVIRLSPDGKTFATASMDHTIRIWNLEGKELGQLTGHGMGVMAVEFSPDGQKLVSASLDGTVRIWDATTCKELLKIPVCDSGVRAVVFLANGKSVVTGDNEGTIRHWDAATGEPKGVYNSEPELGKREAIWGVAWSPDGQSLATASEDAIRLWDAQTGKMARLLGRQFDIVWALAWSPTGKQIASAGRRDGTIHVWDTATGEELFLYGAAHKGGISRLAFSPDGKRLASGGGSYDPSIYIWDTEKGQLLQSLKAPMEFLEGLAWSPDGQRLASVGQDGMLRIWDPKAGKGLRQFQGSVRAFQGVAWSADGKWVATTGQDHAGCLWDPEGVRESRLLGVGVYGAGRSVTFAPDGRTLATALVEASSPVVLWEVATGLKRGELRHDQGSVMAVEYSPEGKRLAFGGDTGRAVIMDVTERMGRVGSELTPAQLTKLWNHLGGDAVSAYKASWLLTLTPNQSVAFLKERLKPAPALDLAKVPAWLKNLDDESFAVRERASRELEKFGEQIEEPLRALRQKTPSLEVRLRIDALLDKLNGSQMSGERLQLIRAVEVLEHAATAEAQALLQELAKGAAEAWLTREVKSSLKRLAQ